MKRNFNYQDLIGEKNPLLQYPSLKEAAIDEFAQKKFEDASLNDILKKAEMSKGSFYHHFGDKFGLYLSLMDIIIKKKIAFFTPIIKREEDSENFFKAIKDIIKGTMEFMYVDERLHHLFNRNMESSDELKEQLINYFPYDFNSGFKPLIEKAILTGQLDRNYSAQFVSKIIEILLSNSYKFITKTSTKEEIINTINQLVDLMEHGISSKGDTKR